MWTDSANEAFEALKKQLAEPPILVAPTDKEPMLLYIAANSKVVSVAVVVERKEEERSTRSKACVLCQRSLDPLQTMLSTLAEVGFWDFHGKPEVEAPLPGASDHGG